MKAKAVIAAFLVRGRLSLMVALLFLVAVIWIG